MRWLAPLCASLLAGCSLASSSPPPEPFRLCVDDAPTQWAGDRVAWAARQWGCVRIAEGRCDGRWSWRSEALVRAPDGPPGVCVHRPDVRVTVCGKAAWAGGAASPMGRVALHEIGHNLGLGHRKVGVMAESIDEIPPGGLLGTERRAGCGLWFAGSSELVEPAVMAAPVQKAGD